MFSKALPASSGRRSGALALFVNAALWALLTVAVALAASGCAVVVYVGGDAGVAVHTQHAVDVDAGDVRLDLDLDLDDGGLF